MNRKGTYRVYGAEGLAVRRRPRRKLKIIRPAPAAVVTRANERWSMDFVHDYLAKGRPLRTLDVVDAFTRLCLAIEVDTSLPAHRVVAVLDRLVLKYGVPESLPSTTGRNSSRCCATRGPRSMGKLDFIQPGKPT